MSHFVRGLDDDRLAHYVDRSEILDVFARYALGMDLGNREMFASVWADDAVWTCKAIDLDVRGIDEILAYFDQGPGAAPPTPSVGGALRLASNQHIRVSGDSARSLAEQVAFRYTGDVVHPYTVGLYDDEFVRTGDGWRFSRRDMIVSPIVRPRQSEAAS